MVTNGQPTCALAVTRPLQVLTMHDANLQVGYQAGPFSTRHSLKTVARQQAKVSIKEFVPPWVAAWLLIAPLLFNVTIMQLIPGH